MNKHLKLTFRIFVLLLTLPLLALTLAPPAKINAACDTATGPQIKITGGLLSAISLTNFSISDEGGVNCISSQPASIPQFSIQSYDQMKKDYYDQAKSTYNKKSISGNKTQNATYDANIIDLRSF